ncbi:MAG: hypothetical protein K9K32_00040 [Halanaerobiales bacterium]|nr:hypothetical protein [Halanaerobiales bacterium]
MIVHLSELDKIDLDLEYEQYVNYKPNGLWYSFDNLWIDLCKEEMSYRISINDNIFLLKLNDKNIYKIYDYDSFIYFVETYIDNSAEFDYEFQGIDWPLVCEKYDGIEIKNYFTLRDDYGLDRFSWFSSLDVPSGCVWNLNIVEILKRYSYKEWENKKIYNRKVRYE